MPPSLRCPARPAPSLLLCLAASLSPGSGSHYAARWSCTDRIAQAVCESSCIGLWSAGVTGIPKNSLDTLKVQMDGM